MAPYRFVVDAVGAGRPWLTIHTGSCVVRLQPEDTRCLDPEYAPEFASYRPGDLPSKSLAIQSGNAAGALTLHLDRVFPGKSWTLKVSAYRVGGAGRCCADMHDLSDDDVHALLAEMHVIGQWRSAEDQSSSGDEY